MNEVLPRINPVGGGRRKQIGIGPTVNHPTFLGGLAGKKRLVRVNGGVSAGVVLSSAGLRRGELIRVSQGNPGVIKRQQEEAARMREAEEKRKAELAALAKAREDLRRAKAEEDEQRKREAERKAAESAAAAYEEDKTAQEQADATEVYDDPQGGFEKAEAEAIPEETVEKPAKKRRGRKGKKAAKAESAAGTEQTLL